MAFDNPFKSLPKPVIIGGIVTVTGVTGYLLYRHHKTTGSWFGGGTTTAAGSAIDPVTGLPTSQDSAIDPVTQMGYLAEAEQYGSVSAAESAVSSFGTTVNSGTGSSTAFGTGSAGSTTLASGAVAANVYTSNAAWAQAAIAGLEDLAGGNTYNGTDIGTAIGDYLQGEPITSAQAQVVNVALAEFPIPTPIPIVIAPASTSSTTTTGTSPTVPTPPAAPAATIKVPNVVNSTADNAEAVLRSVGLSPSITLTAASDKPGIFHLITKTSPAVGTSVAPGTKITLYYRDSKNSS